MKRSFFSRCAEKILTQLEFHTDKLVAHQNSNKVGGGKHVPSTADWKVFWTHHYVWDDRKNINLTLNLGFTLGWHQIDNSEFLFEAELTMKFFSYAAIWRLIETFEWNQIQMKPKMLSFQNMKEDYW